MAAALFAGAVAVPGSGALDGVAGLMSGDAPSVDGELPLGGFLPIQDDPVSIEPFEDPVQLEAVPVGEAPVSEPVRAVLSSARVVDELGESGIPEVALRAYERAADRLGDDDPACGVRWSLLAAIGRVESNHGRFGGARLREDGYGTKPIRGIPLDGRPNVALIRDTDGGALDGDTVYDRAVGPMQFIPSTWRSVGVDANGDGRRDPDNMFDATRGAAGYLCAGGGDLRTVDGQARAVRRYNNADEYVRVVLRLARMYDTGRVTALPSLPALPGPAPLPPPAPAPGPARPGSPPPAGPSAPGPGGAPPTTPSATTAPAPTPTTSPATTVPATPTTPPSTVAPDPPAPTTTTVPAPPTTPTTPETTVPPAPAEPGTELPPAAVGWAPAMREVVVDLVGGGEPEDPGAQVCEPAAADPGAGTDDDGGDVPEPAPGCSDDVPAGDPAAPPAGSGEAPPPPDPATVSTP